MKKPTLQIPQIVDADKSGLLGTPGTAVFNDTSNSFEFLNQSDVFIKVADDAKVVHNTGDQTIAGVITFSSTIQGNISGNAATATSANTLTTPRAIYGNNFDGSAALTQIIDSTYGGTGNGFSKFSGATTSEKTYTLPNASCALLTDNAAVTVAQGGTGQTTYTNGQLLIGNTTGNTLAKATLTGTSNQITVTNGAGAITLSTPQDIAAASSPTFLKMTLSGYTASTTTAIFTFATTVDGNYINIGAGGRNIGRIASTGNLFFTRNLDYDASSSNFKYTATQSASLITLANAGGALSYAVSGTAGNAATILDALTWETSAGNVSIATGNLSIDTAGKTLKIKQGSNACAGSVTLSGATTTVTTSAVATGDQVYFSGRTTMGSAPGFLSYTISNGVSFTITSSTGASDNGVLYWEIHKAA